MLFDQHGAESCGKAKKPSQRTGWAHEFETKRRKRKEQNRMGDEAKGRRETGMGLASGKCLLLRWDFALETAPRFSC